MQDDDKAIAARRRYSPGDVSVVSTGGYVGAYTGLALPDATGTDEDRWYAAGALAGSVGGLLVGDRLVRPRALTEGQGSLVALGSVAGGAVGLGLAHLIVGDDEGDDDSRVYLISSSAGAVAGYGLTFWSLQSDTLRPGMGSGRLQFQVQPAGALLAATRPATSGSSRVAVPVLTGSYRF